MIKQYTELPLERLSAKQLMSLDACTRCGECQRWCPVYTLEGREDVTPRAKIRYLKDVLKGQQPKFLRLFNRRPQTSVMEKFSKVLYDCSCCNQCHFVCPAGLDTVELWENVREAMYIAGTGPVPEQRSYCENLVQFGNPYKKSPCERTSLIDAALAAGTLLERPELITDNLAPVLLFFGCTASYDEKISRVAVHAANILNYAGIEFGILGSEEFCCYGKLRRIGSPEFTVMARANIETLNNLGIHTLVTACAGCFKTLRNDYSKLAKANYKVYHLTEYIDMLFAEGRIRFETPITGKVTYHDPCLLGRHLGVYEQPRRIIRSIPGLELVEMDRNRRFSRCCGMGGGLKMANHDLQEAASVYRIRDAEVTGAEYLTTPCPTCFSGLAGGAAKVNSTLKVRHLAELAAMSIGIKASEV